MRILVTGASGRVGKEVVAGLKKKLKEATVVAATRDTTSSSEYLKSLGADEVVRYTYSITLDTTNFTRRTYSITLDTTNFTRPTYSITLDTT